MTIGEFDEVDHILYRVPNVIEFEFSTYLLWLIFVIVMAILLQNMLVCPYATNCYRKQCSFIIVKLNNSIVFFQGWFSCG